METSFLPPQEDPNRKWNLLDSHFQVTHVTALTTSHFLSKALLGRLMAIVTLVLWSQNQMDNTDSNYTDVCNHL